MSAGGRSRALAPHPGPLPARGEGGDPLVAAAGQPVAGHRLTQDELTRAVHEGRVLEIGSTLAIATSWALSAAGEILPRYLVFPRRVPKALVPATRWSDGTAAFDAFGVRTSPVPLHERHPELVAAVLAAPDDDAPRRVLADALLDAGDPRGELIALQLSGDDPDTERRLLRDHGPAWREELGLLGYECRFHRGFVEHVVVRKKTAELGAAWKHSPIRSLQVEGQLDALLDLELEGLKTLAVEGGAVTRETLARLIIHPMTHGLEELAFIAVRGLDVSLAAGAFPKLKRLDIARSGLDRTEIGILRHRFGDALTWSAA